MTRGQTFTQTWIIRPHTGRALAVAALLSLTLFLPQPLRAAEENSGAPSPGVVDSIQDWLASANRAFQGTIVRRLSTPSPGESDDAIAQKLKDVKDQERAAKEAEEAKRRAEAEADAKRKDDERQAAEVAQAKAEADARAKEDADAKAMLEDAKRNADDAIKAAQKLAEERQAAEQKKKDDEEAAARQADAERVRDEARKAEEQRQAAAAAADAERNKQRTITLTPEPLPRATRQTNADEMKIASADDVQSTSRRYERHMSRGPVVKRWIWRARSQCLYAGRRHRGRYTVRAGDTLWLISKRYYNRGSRYRRILQANRWLYRHPNLIRPCQRLYLPRWRPHR